MGALEGLGLQVHVLDRIVVAREGYGLVTEEPLEEMYCLFQALHPCHRGIEGNAGRRIIQREPASTNAKLKATF
jgi:hypothetical protein